MGDSATLQLQGGSAGARSVPIGQLQSTVFDASEMVVSLLIPFSSAAQSYRSYKTRARHQLAHPIVNAAFTLTLAAAKDPASGAPIIQSLQCAFGGLPGCALTGVFLAPQTCAAVANAPLTEASMKSAIAALAAETVPTDAQLAARAIASPGLQTIDPAYATSLATALLYKFFLAQFSTQSAAGAPALPPRDVSASVDYVRPLSSGSESFVPGAGTAPVGQPLPKLEAAVQATGEARYTNDEPMTRSDSSLSGSSAGGSANAIRGGLHGSLVYSTQATGTIVSIDASVALSMPGVVSFISAADLSRLSSGKGGFNDCGAFPGDEEIFASTQVFTCGQSLGMVLAESQQQAHAAAISGVTVTYAANPPPPLVSLDAAIAAKAFLPDNAYTQCPSPLIRGDVVSGFAASQHVLSASLLTGCQAHFSLETQSAYAIPGEEGRLDVWDASQGTQDVRQMLAHALNTQASKITVRTRRAGGAFGAKLSRNHPLAAAVAIAAVLTNRPVKSICDRRQDMQMWGKRPLVRLDYQVGFNSDGKLLALQVSVYQQGGHSYESNFGTLAMALSWLDNCSFIPNFSVAGQVCRTNTPSNTSMRGPGALKAIFAMESILDRVAWELSLSPAAVREANFYTEGQLAPYLQPVTQIDRLMAAWKLVQTQADYPTQQADVAAFNAQNRWRKQGVHLSTVKYGITDSGEYNQAVVLLSVCSEDGSVQVSTSGVELGQGLNTKVAAAVAYALAQGLQPQIQGADGDALMQLISVQASATDKTCNGAQTGGSSTSEMCCAAALQAANVLLQRLKPILSANPSVTSWPALVSAAASSCVDLQVSSQVETANAPPTAPFTYFVYAAACSRVEIDVLTGEVQVLSADIVYDCGSSLSPLIDVGQIEGGFLIGLGNMLIEETLTMDGTGEQITAGTWDYHIPSSQDIPLSLNVSLLPSVPNALGVLGSKATAEPPVMLAASAFLAVRDAIAAARSDAGNKEWFDLQTPATTQRIQQACLVTNDSLVL